MATNLVRTIQYTPIINSDVLYIDPQNSQFPDNVLYSVHLEINDPLLGKLEYNSMYEETIAPNNKGPVFIPSNGTNADLKGQLLEEITITLYQRPQNTYIIKPKKTTIGTEQIWKLPNDYDMNNEYSYCWEIVTQLNMVPIAIIISGEATKEVTIKILNRGLLYLKCNIRHIVENSTSGCSIVSGCAKTPRVIQEIGLDLDTFAVSTNRSNE
jgi:hypothetical protein